MCNQIVLFTCSNPLVQRERVIALALLLTNTKIREALDCDIKKIVIVGWLPWSQLESEASKAKSHLKSIAGEFLKGTEIILEETAVSTSDSAQKISAMLWKSESKSTWVLTSQSHLKRATDNLSETGIDVVYWFSSEAIIQQRLWKKWKTHEYHIYFWFLEKFWPLLYRINPKIISPIKSRANTAK